MVSKGLIKMGRIFEFYVDLVDKPGEFLRVAEVLADLNANIVKIQHNQFNAIEWHNHVRLIITLETEGHDHIKRIANALESHGYKVNHKE